MSFPDDVVRAVLVHMNGDHRDDNLLIARAFGSEDATAATMIALDADVGTWAYSVDGVHRELTLPWSTRLTERPQIRLEIVRLYEQACERLGVAARPH